MPMFAGGGVSAVPVPHPAAAHRPRARAYGALDLGTNNCRLLIARPSGSGFTIVDAFSRIVRLGEGLVQSGRLSDAAQDRAIDALGTCADKLARRGIAVTRNVATEACRRASNGAAFVDRVYDETGIALDVITPAEEARLAVLGCQSLIDADGPPALVFDIGGGSTELSVVRTRGGNGSSGEPEMLAWTSVPWGVVSLAETEAIVLSPPERLPAYARMRALIAGCLTKFAGEVAARAPGPLQLLGTSGTITTLASVHLGLPAYDRRQVDGCTVTAASMHDICALLASKAPAERALVGCIGHERADLVVAGCAILEEILTVWPAATIRVADRGIREGILRTLMTQGMA